MITLFGKKKKEDEKRDNPQNILPPPAPPIIEADPNKPEESPFAKIFQSISQEYQNTTPPNRPETVGAPPLSVTPDWVQPRQLPKSKPMVITPSGVRVGGSPKPLDEEGWGDKNSKSPSVLTSARPISPPANTQPQTLSRQPSNFRLPDDEHSTPTKDPSPAPNTTNPESRNVTSPEEESALASKPPTSFDTGNKGRRDDERNGSGARDSSTFMEGLAAIDSSGEFSLSGFDDISKLLAETDSVLAQGREKEKELETERPTGRRKEPIVVLKEPEQTPTPSGLSEGPDKDNTNETKTKSLEHIFELTQGSLNSPGLAVIDGTSGSGKTTLCLGLADRYLRQGNPCIFVTYNQSPATVRDDLKKIGCDVDQYESSYRFMIIDAFSAQSGTFSMELYSLLEPWDVSKLQETVAGNCAVFIGETVRVLIDSLDGLVDKVGGKDFAQKFDPFVSKLKESNATVVATVDLSRSGKDVKGWAEDESDCLVEIDLEKGKNGMEHSLTVNRAKASKIKGTSEEWDVQPGKGIVFV